MYAPLSSINIYRHSNHNCSKERDLILRIPTLILIQLVVVLLGFQGGVYTPSKPPCLQYRRSIWLKHYWKWHKTAIAHHIPIDNCILTVLVKVYKQLGKTCCGTVSTDMFHLLCHQMLIIVHSNLSYVALKRTLKYNHIRQVLTVYTTGLFVQAWICPAQ